MEDYKGERRHMTPENLTPIIALFDERFAQLRQELKEYISMIDHKNSIKMENVCKDVEDLKNSDDHKDLEDRLNERFLVKMDILNNSVKSLENAVTKDQVKIEKRLDDHDVKIEKLENAEAERARKLLNKIKDNAIAWLVPTLLIALAIFLGLNIPGIGK